MGELFAWLISFFILIGLLVIIVFQLMCLADLEFDYINPYDSASRINRVIIPEFFTQGGLSLFFLVTGHWFMALLCVPCLYCNVKMLVEMCCMGYVTSFVSIPCPLFLDVLYNCACFLHDRYMDNQHLVDVTEIFNMLHWEKKKRLFKLAYLIFILFLSLFWYKSHCYRRSHSRFPGEVRRWRYYLKRGSHGRNNRLARRWY
ncbi:hypothetical protein Cgig2_002482 [Carnegiea gigantea]|uniref:Uncharacterized protein n=1 Tax=Carnegiea gigantea TaxID=171969 RepID=A0A9Q1KUK2_9CARY|nr:hypothetical protein Cgig2_002482 [Carnegiea gigantea]